jgi:RNA-dependent RNA polymerase
MRVFLPHHSVSFVQIHVPILRPLRLPSGHILCHHVIVTPSRILLEGPHTAHSNRVIYKYQSHDPALTERFIHGKVCDDNRLASRSDHDVNGS